MFAKLAIASFTYAHAVQYLVVDSSKFDACNFLRTRTSETKLFSLLFNSDSLSGNIQSSKKAMEEPDVWARVNSLEADFTTSSPGSSPLKMNKGARQCDSIERLVELAMTIGAGFISGELDQHELATTVADLINSNIRTLNLTRLPITAEDLYDRYHQRALTTPLLTYIPSCEKPAFAFSDGADYDWPASIRSHGQSLYDDLTARVNNCDDCIYKFVDRVTSAAGVTIPRQVVERMMKKFDERVREAIKDFETLNMPNTLGDIAAFYINKSKAAPKITSKPGEANASIDRMITILDAINEEVISGSGPINTAFKELKEAMGC